MIRHKSFNHGWFYHYRVHSGKAESLCKTCYSGLTQYMNRIFDCCPDHYFQSGPRSSALRYEVLSNKTEVKGHEVSKLAEIATACPAYKTAHTNVEVYMLEKDSNTVAVEVPIWLLPDEFEYYRALLNSEEPLSGHIDILRVENDNIWVWDYKPNAHKEKFADCQTLFYSIMLSKRTGIPLEQFRCGYFDEKTAYVFKPQITQLPIVRQVLK